MSVSLRDMRFLIHEVFDFEAHYRQLTFADPPGRELIDAVLEEAARFTEGELAPLNRPGDEAGCSFHDGTVTTPPGFKEAYAKYIEGGWASLTGRPEYGGQGLPHSLSLFLEELMCTANMAWTMYPGLSRGVINALEAHGSDTQKQTFLPQLLSGAWTGTMCLTEPQAGSDVGLAKTRAESTGDGGYTLTGTKIFISAGEHDMAENIVHLVLARLPDAPAGTSGISMFIVPKFNLDGSRNAVHCGSIEEKMGIHGNATCVLHFEGAQGELVGELNKGMRNMFTMMNAARLVVGLQGVCGAHAALSKASQYATERLQMRALSGPKYPDAPADPLLVHPDVRRLLLTQRAIVEGGRGLIYYTSQVADVVHAGGTEADRAEAQVLLDFLTPVVKGVLTELGFESANHAVQVFGGHGFIRETGVEQFVRDLRITTIYEGTTGIQGLDLLGRKILQKQGAGLIAFIAQINQVADELKKADGLTELGAALAALAQEWGELALNLGAAALEDIDEAGAAAVDFLYFSGYAALAFSWGRIALAAAQQPAAGSGAGQREPHEGALLDAEYLAGKIATAHFYFARILPRTAAHKAAIEAGAGSLMDMSDAALTAI